MANGKPKLAEQTLAIQSANAAVDRREAFKTNLCLALVKLHGASIIVLSAVGGTGIRFIEDARPTMPLAWGFGCFFLGMLSAGMGYFMEDAICENEARHYSALIPPVGEPSQPDDRANPILAEMRRDEASYCEYRGLTLKQALLRRMRATQLSAVAWPLGVSIACMNYYVAMATLVGSVIAMCIDDFSFRWKRAKTAS